MEKYNELFASGAGPGGEAGGVGKVTSVFSRPLLSLAGGSCGGGMCPERLGCVVCVLRTSTTWDPLPRRYGGSRGPISPGLPDPRKIFCAAGCLVQTGGCPSPSVPSVDPEFNPGCTRGPSLLTLDPPWCLSAHSWFRMQRGRFSSSRLT